MIQLPRRLMPNPEYLFPEAEAADWIIHHLGTDGFNCPWNATLIHDGQFHSASAATWREALQLAYESEPYTPDEPNPPAVEESFNLLSLIPSSPMTRRC